LAITAHNFGLQFSLDIDARERELTAAKFGLDDAAIDNARRRAINRTAQWFQGQLARQLAADLDARRNILNRRYRLAKAKRGANSRDMTAYIWFGANPLDATALRAKGHASGSGYQMGRHHFTGAFRAFTKTHTGHYGIFARKGEQRLPLVRQTLAIKDQAQDIVSRLVLRGEQRLFRELRHELEYEVERRMNK
jgi:hypothetical protein